MSLDALHQRIICIALGYPDAELLERIPTLRRALCDNPVPVARRFALPGAVAARESQSKTRELVSGFLDHLYRGVPADLQHAYVQTFVLNRKHALHLSSWTEGDTRRRGEVPTRFKKAYRESGFKVDTHGELPDYLPMVLEFTALADAQGGPALLQEYRASIELLRLALEEADSPFALLLQAVSGMLPGPTVKDRAAAMALAGHGPPVESVGLEPFNRELLPVRSV